MSELIAPPTVPHLVARYCWLPEVARGLGEVKTARYIAKSFTVKRLQECQ